jgi:hypothetical protein
MKKLYTLVFFLTTSIMLGQSNYLVENFDYAAAAPLTSNGWTSHSGGTTNPISLSAAGLTFPSYIGSGVGNAALVTNTGQDLNKRFGADISSGTIYASFLLKLIGKTALPNSTTYPYFFHLGYYDNDSTGSPVLTTVNGSFRARTFVKQGTDPDTQFKLGLAFNATATQGETPDLTIGQTYLVVVKYKFIDGATNDEVSLFVYSTSDAIPSTEPATPTLGPFTNTPSGTVPVPTADAPVLQNVVLRQYLAGQNVTVDGIYVRTEWNLVDAGTALSTDDFALSQISLYPNPVVSVLNVNINSNLIDQPYSIIDGLGRVVLKGKLNEVESTINVAQLSKGIYYIKLSDNKSSKFIKE